MKGRVHVEQVSIYLSIYLFIYIEVQLLYIDGLS